MDAPSYFEHDADIGVIGRGPTPEAAFESAARAVFAIMAPGARDGAREVQAGFEEADLELALVRWINALLAGAKVDGLALARFELSRDRDHWSGKAWGEPWSADLERGVEVKGATLTELRVARSGDGWDARCVVDV